MNLDEFSIKSKTIRKNLKLTQEYVSKITNISRRQLSRFENGEIILSINDLMTLSTLYKVNLIKILANFYETHNEEVMNIIDSIELALQELDYEKINSLLPNLYNFINLNKFVKQYYYFSKGIYYLEAKNQNLDLAYDNFVKALKVFNNNYNINNCFEYRYSILELRILTAIALYHKYKNQNNEYEKLMTFSFKNCQDLNLTYFIISIHYAKMLKNKNDTESIKKALDIIDDCIEKANNKKYRDFLPVIYYIRFRIHDKLKDFESSNKDLQEALKFADKYDKNIVKNLIIKKINFCLL